MNARAAAMLMCLFYPSALSLGCTDDEAKPDHPEIVIVEDDLASPGFDADMEGSDEDATPDHEDMRALPDMREQLEVDESPLEQPIAGRATVDARADLPFATLIADLPLESFQAASRGREFFVADWEPGQTGRELLDGLGPLFHVASCQGCHPATGRPPTFLAGGEVGPGILFRLGSSEGAPDPVYGGQLQPRALSGIAPEASIRWYARGSDEGVGEGAPSVALGSALVVYFEALGYGDFDASTRFGPRLSPHLTGMGLLDDIPLETLEGLEDPDDLDGDGISGRIHWLEGEGGARVVGRYGWKSNIPTLRAQVAGAFVGDMGLTSPLRPEDDCMPPQAACVMAPDGGVFEVSDSGLDAVVDYLRLLGVPARRVVDPELERRGYHRFVQIGCASCHIPTLRTLDFDPESPLSGQTIHPFTDLLLHDMGEGLADGLPDGDASGSEWRTPPLWGLGRVVDDPRARLLHDGRASSIEEAILMHGGEAAGVVERYAALSGSEREALLAFLHTL